MAQSLLDQTGSDWTYSRGATSATVTLYKSDGPPPAVVEVAPGQLTEIDQASFRGLTADLTAFTEPRRGDRIQDATEAYEVWPMADKCYYTVGGMIHIHAKRVKR